ncbi:MAG: penicillin-binding protein 2 [Bacteroidales bacterium]
MVDVHDYRKYYVWGTIALLTIILIVRVFYIQVLSPEYEQYARNNAIRQATIYPARGIIYDRNNKLMVVNKSAYDLMITPYQVSHLDTLALAKVINIPYDSLRMKLKVAMKRYNNTSIIKSQIDQAEYMKISEQLYQFSGFSFEKRIIRDYKTSVASHIIGYLGATMPKDIEADPYYTQADYIGMSGLEREYEKSIRGVKGKEFTVVDHKNRFKKQYDNGIHDIPSINGDNLHTTIDIDLQTLADSLMQNKKGAVVAIEPETGELLTFLSAPNYNLSRLVGNQRGENYEAMIKDSLKPMFNRASSTSYPPGSTFKIAQSLVGLKKGILEPQTKYLCAGGYSVGRLHVRCHHSANINLKTAIAKSCNAYYCHTFSDYLENKQFPSIRDAYLSWRNDIMLLGYGESVSMDVNPESTGSVPTAEYYDKTTFNGYAWRPTWIISLSIGQGELGVTPLQLANHCALVANRGYYRKPHLVKRVGNKDIIAPKIDSQIDSSTFDIVVEGMKSVMEPGGTAGWYSLDNVQICGKTGTVENPHGKDHATFIAFAPKDNPKIAVAVFVENAGFGSTHAAPIASIMIDRYLNGSLSEKSKARLNRVINTNLLEK